MLHAVHGSLSSTPPCEDRQVLCLAVLPGWHIDPMPVAPWACNVLKLVPIHTKQPLRCCRHQNRGCWASGQDACMMQAQLYSLKYFSVHFSVQLQHHARRCWMNPVRLLATRRVVKPAAEQTRDGKSSKSTNLLHLHTRTLVSAQLLHPVMSKTAPNAGKHRPSGREDPPGLMLEAGVWMCAPSKQTSHAQVATSCRFGTSSTQQPL